MILVDNRNVLRLRNRELLTHLSIFEKNHEDFKALVEPSRTGVPTLKLVIDGKTQYIHSKYDPEKEAERLMIELKDIGNSKHILFVGSGLGYHIEKFTEQHPTIRFSIYEPNEEVLVSYLSNRKLNDLPISNLGTIFTGSDETKLHQEIAALMQLSNSELRIYTLPVYESLYGDQIKVIMQKSLASMKAKHSALVTNHSFQKRWTINSIKNFPTVLKTPNILHDIDRSAFEGKPAIIVAAGPSLNEEIENLRYIKKNGLAYIFSVGSAINALIEHGIYPDAACTYDPQDINYRVIQIIKEKKLSEIPLIFGSSVGFETLENYPGKLLHMIVSQDTVSPILLKHNQFEHLVYVNDAPSIAVVTFQLLSKIGFDKVILVGQNLAYLKNKRYAEGIDYGTGSEEVNEEHLTKALIVKDVHGDNVKTTEGFNMMRNQLEMYISHNSHIDVVNTTKGGAAIDGTSYKSLYKLINQQLRVRVVSDGWANVDNDYNSDYLKSQLVDLDKQHNVLEKVLKDAMSRLEKVHRKVTWRTFSNIEVDYSRIDKEIELMKDNLFYKSFIEPMIRVQNEQLANKIQSVRYETNQVLKGEIVVREFHQFLTECSQHYYLVSDLYEEMKKQLD